MKTASPVIEIKNLCRRFGPREAVNGLNITLQPGRCYGFFGRNGAGKTTTIKCLNTSGILAPIEVGLRDDGTLWYWNWGRVQHLSRGPLSERTAPTGLVQIGSDTHWVAVAGGWLGLKTDGSIWKWTLLRGDNVNMDSLQRDPERLGTHHDWVAVGYWLAEHDSAWGTRQRVSAPVHATARNRKHS